MDGSINQRAGCISYSLSAGHGGTLATVDALPGLGLTHPPDRRRPQQTVPRAGVTLGRNARG